MAYLGSVPSEHSSGASVRRGGITKAGNGAARRLLIEAAWATASRPGSAASCCKRLLGALPAGQGTRSPKRRLIIL
jgi:transposase